MNFFKFILIYFVESLKKIRNYLLDSKRREFLVFVIFLLISFIFWYLQALQSTNEFKLDIPITYSKLPDSIDITNELPKSLTVDIRDKGKDLFSYIKNKEDMSVYINLMNWYKDNDISNIPVKFFESNIRTKLRQTTQIISITPNNIPIHFIKNSRKVVPIRVDAELKFAPQYKMISEPVVSPTSVLIYAPNNLLDSITSVSTETVKEMDLNHNVRRNIRLKKIEGVKFSKNNVDVKINVEEYTEQSFIIPIKGINFPDNMKLICFPQNVKVSFIVGISEYKNISKDDFAINIDYLDLIKSKESIVSLKLDSKPEGLENVRIIPDKIDYLIRMK